MRDNIGETTSTDCPWTCWELGVTLIVPQVGVLHSLHKGVHGYTRHDQHSSCKHTIRCYEQTYVHNFELKVVFEQTE